MTLLTSNEIIEKLGNLSNWFVKENALEKEWLFRNFTEALNFINKVGELAEIHNHHPELYNVYSKVKLRFNTHDEGGITEKDFKIAREIDSIQ